MRRPRQKIFAITDMIVPIKQGETGDLRSNKAGRDLRTLQKKSGETPENSVHKEQGETGELCPKRAGRGLRTPLKKSRAGLDNSAQKEQGETST